MNKYRSFPVISIVCGIIAVVIIWLAMPAVHYQPRGVFLPAKDMPKLAATQPSKVEIINTFPAKYITLGSVNTELHTLHNNLAEQKAIVRFSKQLAAKYGANAVVVKQFFPTNPTGPESGMSAYIFYGTAIKAE